MVKARIFVLASCLTMCAAVSAQVGDGDWRDNERAEQLGVSESAGGRSMVRRIGSQESAPIKAKGTKRIPLVLVEFPDRPFEASGSNDEEVRATFDTMLNGTDALEVQSKVHSYGSARMYFSAMSREQLTLDFSVIGPIRLPEGYAFYGKNSGSSKDVSIGTLYRQAVEQAVKDYSVDWSNFDNDGNGTVDMIYFIHAGWGENTVSRYDPDAIWAKEGVRSLNVTVSGGEVVTFDCYGVSAEARYIDKSQIQKDIDSGKYGTSGYNPKNLQVDGVGVVLHEVSHALGLPDFYDTNYQAYGMDLWSLMDYGVYGSNGYGPSAYTAYERSFMGWEELQVLDEPQMVTLLPFARGGRACKVVNHECDTEYYVLENRQPEGWDISVCGGGRCGLQVTHVDYNSETWTKNRVNTDAKHQRMTIIPANNELIGSGMAETTEQWFQSLAGNLYPGNTYNYELTDESTPAAVVYNGAAQLMGQPIRGIKQHDDGSVTFFFRTHGKLDTPSLLEVKRDEDNQLRAAWETVEDAKAYIVEITEEGGMPTCVTTEEESFTFEELKAGASYKFRVKATVLDAEELLDSEWSDYVYADAPTSVGQITEGDGWVKVYSMDAQPITRCRASEVRRISVHPGIYVLKYDNGRVRKMILR